MTLAPVEPGLLAALADTVRDDPAGGLTLLQLAMYEELVDVAKTHGDTIDGWVSKAADLRVQRMSDELVRVHLERRAAGLPVDDVLAAAQALVGVAKADDVPQWNAEHPDKPKDAKGRWTDRLAHFVTRRGDDKRSDLDRIVNGTGDSKDRKLYSRLSAAGQVLQTMQPTAALGQVAAYVGEIGPEAEKVLGEHVRRTAYRYRGTETRLPAGARNALTVNVGGTKMKLADVEQVLHEDTKPGAGGVSYADRAQSALEQEASTRGQDPAAAIALFWAHPNVPTDQARLGAVSDALTLQLADDIPDLHHARISLEAGKLPPSVGYIVDEDGDVVSRAVGFNGDHYLPFDLKNLHRLWGGGYVRTRTTGGPTDEDIYTGLVTGARQITVASNSGVFTVEFDPDLRGGRRFSDKAHQMVGRYAELLKTIDSGKLLQRPLDPTRMAALRAQALRESGNDPEKARTRLRDLLATETQRLQFEGGGADRTEEATAARQAATMAGASAAQRAGTANPSRQQLGAAMVDDRYAAGRAASEQAANEAKVYQLDGEGYQAALTALRQEFPQFIRQTSFQPWSAYYRSRGLVTGERGIPARKDRERARDIGATNRGALVPKKLEKPAAGVSEPKPASASLDTPGNGNTTTATPVSANPDSITGKLTTLSEPAAAEVRRTVGLALSAVGSANAPHLEPGDATDVTEQESLSEPPDMWIAWALKDHGPRPAGVAQWLADPKTDPAQLAKANDLIEELAKTPRSDADSLYGFGAARKALAALREMREPFRKVGDPAFTEPDLANPVPPYYSDVDDLGTDIGRWTAYGNQHSDVIDAAHGWENADDKTIARDINAALGRVQRLQQFVRTGVKPAGMSDEDETAARELENAQAGGDLTRSGEWQRMNTLQQAWAVHRALRLVRDVIGDPTFGESLGDDAGDAPGPKAPVPVRKSSLQPYLVLIHPLGSPLAKAMARETGAAGPTSHR